MLACSLFNEQDKGSNNPEYDHIICIGKTKCTSEKGLLSGMLVSGKCLKRGAYNMADEDSERRQTVTLWQNDHGPRRRRPKCSSILCNSRFHMTSLKFKQQKYWSSWYFPSMMLKRTMAVHVRYNSRYISLPSSTRRNVVWPNSACLENSYSESNTLFRIQFRGNFDSAKQG